MIDGIMRKLGYISEKKLIDVAVHVYESNDERKAEGQNNLFHFFIAVAMQMQLITS